MQRNDITTRVKVSLEELGCFDGKGAWSYQFESFTQFLDDKVRDKMNLEIDYLQIVCYSIVDHGDASVTFEVEWYEEE